MANLSRWDSPLSSIFRVLRPEPYLAADMQIVLETDGTLLVPDVIADARISSPGTYELQAYVSDNFDNLGEEPQNKRRVVKRRFRIEQF